MSKTIKIELLHVVNERKFHLGFYLTVQDALQALRKHLSVHSAISHPILQEEKLINGYKLTYGAKDCYYMLRFREVYK